MAQQLPQAQYPATALLHRRCARQGPACPRAGGHRHRRPRGGAQAGACREYNPFESIKTNILGAQNVIEAAIDTGVKTGRRALHRQGRRPDQPLRRHQALLGQAVRRRQQHQGHARHPLQRRALRQRHGQPRLGHPVLPRSRRKTGVLPITDPAHDPLQHQPAGRRGLVLWALENACRAGRSSCPRSPATASWTWPRPSARSASTEIVGIRPGEKIHEEMITASDSAQHGRPRATTSPSCRQFRRLR